MVQRKYLAINLIIILTTIIAPCSYASAYLPKAGNYKYFLSSAFVDKMSNKKRRQKIDLFIQAQDFIYMYRAEQESIRNNARQENRALLNSEQRNIETLDQVIKKYEKITKEIAAFNDNTTSYFEVEYGVTDQQSVGMKIDYSTSKFAEIKNNKATKTNYVGKGLDLFYKYKLFENDKFIVTLQPKLHYSTYHNNTSSSIDMGLLFGHSQESKKYKTFQEFSITLRKHFDQHIKNSLGYVISMTEGAQFNNGILIINYTEYEHKNSAHWLDRAIIYEQVSIAKIFSLDTLDRQSVTAQLGYFWKGSVAKSPYAISGPIFTLWFDL